MMKSNMPKRNIYLKMTSIAVLQIFILQNTIALSSPTPYSNSNLRQQAAAERSAPATHRKTQTPYSKNSTIKSVKGYRGLSNVPEEVIGKMIAQGYLSPKKDSADLTDAKAERKALWAHLFGISVGKLQSFSPSLSSAKAFGWASPFKNKAFGPFSWIPLVLIKAGLMKGNLPDPGNKNIIIESNLSPEQILYRSKSPLMFLHKGGMVVKGNAAITRIWEIKDNGELSLLNSIEPTEKFNDDKTAADLGAQVSHVKNLNRLLRVLHILKRDDSYQNYSDKEILELCLKYLEKNNHIVSKEDEDGNLILTISNSALNNSNEDIQRIANAVRKWAIDIEGGVRALNFKGNDNKWKIVGFENELKNPDTLNHEQLEIKYRKQGISWIEAHNRVVRETGIGKEIDEASVQNTGTQDDIGTEISANIIPLTPYKPYEITYTKPIPITLHKTPLTIYKYNDLPEGWKKYLNSKISFFLIDPNAIPNSKLLGAKALRHGGEIILGRSNALIQQRFNFNNNISRRHLKIKIKEGDRIIVEDLGSANGSWIKVSRDRSSVTQKDAEQPVISEAIVRKNTDKIFSSAFLNVLVKESIGGNAEVAGIFWNDFDDLAQSMNANQIKQIVGHTPERIKGSNKPKAPTVSDDLQPKADKYERDLISNKEESLVPEELIIVPKSLGRLGKEWPSLVRQIPGLTPKMEEKFRFGRKVIKWFDGTYKLFGTITGGETIIAEAATEKDYRIFLEWKKLEGISSAETEDTYNNLSIFLNKYGIKLEGEAPKWKGAYKLAKELLEKLPGTYLNNGEIKEIIFGAEGSGGAKGSEWDDGKVKIFSFVIESAQRTFVGMFMHEIGHGMTEIIENLPKEKLNAFKDAHSRLAQAKVLYGTTFWQSAESRKSYTSINFDEFIAETFMIYVTQGDALREHINNIEDAEVRKAYTLVYNEFKKILGVEYNRKSQSGEKPDINLAAGQEEAKISHTALNDYIQTNLPADLHGKPENIINYKKAEGYGVAARAVSIAGLFKNTGQFGHIGLGQVYGEPVIYVDAELLEEEQQDVLNHELFEISKWEALRKQLNKKPAEMRRWIKKNYKDAKLLDKSYHLQAPSIDHLFEKYESRIDRKSVGHLRTIYGEEPKEYDINISAVAPSAQAQPIRPEPPSEFLMHSI